MKSFWKVWHEESGLVRKYSVSECKKSTTALKRFSKETGIEKEILKVDKVEFNR